VDEELVQQAEKLGAEYVLGRKKSPTVNSSELEIMSEDEI
jgi:hypothetical protein